GITPCDRGLSTQAIQVFLAFTTQLLLADPVADVPTRLFEGSKLRISPRLELQYLISTLSADRFRDVTHLHASEKISERGGQFIIVQRSDETAVGLGCRDRVLTGEPGKRF